jgi:hypothetical protein
MDELEKANKALDDGGFTVIPESERVELLDRNCKHEQAYVVTVRPDGLLDCYCPCGVGGIVRSLEEFRG